MKRLFEILNKIKPLTRPKIKKVLLDNVSISLAPTKIALICMPCNGNGDVIFAIRLLKFLTKFKDVEIKIYTTVKASFISFGIPEESLVEILPTKSKDLQCRRMERMKIQGLTQDINTDLYFVAPIVADYDANYLDVSKLFPKSNFLNTYFFSEYNDSTRKKFDFHTGVGKGIGKKDRDGILIDKTLKEAKTGFIEKYNLTPNYALAYIANIARSSSCLNSFVEMVAGLYKNTNLDIIVPSWYNPSKDLKKELSKNFEVLEIKGDSKEISKEEKNSTKKTLRFRGDIFPVKNEVMIELIRNSIKEVLVTGDQSLTDVLSCCPEKKIFYQTATWKTNLAKNIAKELSLPYLAKASTSCGIKKIRKGKPPKKEIDEKWNFFKASKSKIEKVLSLGIFLRENPELEKILVNTRADRVLKKLSSV